MNKVCYMLSNLAHEMALHFRLYFYKKKLKVGTLKYLINEHVRLLSLDFDSTMFVYFPACSFIFLTFFPLCSFIT